MRNIEVLRDYYLGKDPQLKETLADNSLRLIGVRGEYFVQRAELVKALEALNTALVGDIGDAEKRIHIEIDDNTDALLEDINELANELDLHERDDVRHLTQALINKIDDAMTRTEAAPIIEQEVQSMMPEITAQATAVSKQYTDKVKADLEKQIGDMNLPTVIDPETGEEETQPISEALEVNPQKIINPEYFFRFKNMINNSSFEVFNGTTLRPLGWDNGIVTENASMFHSHSLKLTSGQVSKQTQQHQADVTWMQGAYDTNDVIIAFYHKWDAVGIKVYDMVNESYLTLTALDSDLSDMGSNTEIIYPYAENWNQYRCMVKFTPASNTRYVRIEFGCKTGGTKGECFIDAPSMEPYVDGEYPSIYKDGRYSESAYQLLNPPPGDADRFTPLEHFSTVNSQADANGNITYQELVRDDGSLAIKRQASNQDQNGYYQTIVETFYKADGTTVNYIDTYSFTYTDTGAILTESKTTTEVW